MDADDFVMRTTRINERWDLVLPEWRCQFWENPHREETRIGWEHERMDDMCDRTRLGDTIWDVGAEIGDMTALYRKWAGEGGDCIAVEPSPPYWPILREIWEANRLPLPVASFPGFIGPHVDTKPPGVDHPYDHRQPFKVWPDAAYGEGIPEFGFRHLAQQTLSTPTVSLDVLADAIGPPTVIQMDIEGAEWAALSSGEALFMCPDRPRSVYVAVHDGTLQEWYHKTPEDIDALMDRFGYDRTEIIRTHEWAWRYDAR